MLNQITLQGRFTADPETKTTANSGSFCSFMIASERPKDSKGERKTDFIPCMAWGKTAEFISQYFRKGDMAIISGRLQSRNYEKDGQKRCAYEIYAMQIDFCGGGKRQEEPSGNSDAYGYIPTTEAPFEL